ncbi:MAG TPA: hypothetical protein VGM21_02650 [Actinomycetota bacterium]
MSRVRLRPPQLPRARRARRLTPAEAAALKARPWPRLPWWLWLAAVVTTAAMVTVAIGLVRAAPAPLPVAARRSPPTADQSHGVGSYRVPARDPANRDRLVRRQAGCPRLAAVTLAGTAGEVALLEAAAERLCALGSVAPIERARAALHASGAVVEFAEFELGINDSTTVFGQGRPVVLVNGKFQVGGRPERIAALLVHEGSHVADGGPPTAAGELAARKTELAACGRLFTGDVQPNRGCADAAVLLADDDATVLAELRKAGYR